MSGSLFSSSSGAQGYDVKTQSGLTSMYNEKVVSQQRVTRGLESGINVGPLHHEGVVVNTDKGNSYLVHKGANYGTETGGNAVVVNTKHMSHQWERSAPEPVTGSKNVGGYVGAMGPGYSLSDHCQHGASRALDYGRK